MNYGRAVAIGLALSLVPLSHPATTARAADAAPVVSALEAGARYGQALGALEICHGSKITAKAKGMGDVFTGADHDAFKAQAGKVYQAWHAVKTCAKQIDPNQCKIIMDKSCETAEAEIGAAGKIMPGLVEFAKH